MNLLRTTVAAFAAGVGGADAVTVLPFDSPLGRPDAFGRRIARNISRPADRRVPRRRVTDPAGGAYAVEKLTDDLAAPAWDVFGRIEDRARTWPRHGRGRRGRGATGRSRRRRRPITGLSEFPNLAEAAARAASRRDRATGVRRYGAAFEALRDDPPSAHVFLATLGPVAAHTARAGFATNLLAAGGVAVDVAGATAGVDDLVAAYAGQRGRLPGRHRRGVRRVGREAAAAPCARPARRRVVLAGKPADVGRRLLRDWAWTRSPS